MRSDQKRWCRFAAENGPALGLVRDDRIVRVEGDLFGEWRETGVSVPLAGARLLPPVIPPTFYCVGLNYRTHVLQAHAGGLAAANFPARPEIGYRTNNALIGHEEA